MSTIKVYCGQCGQRVSGDESFYGTVEQCPICSSDIRFPDAPGQTAPVPEPPVESAPIASSYQVPFPPVSTVPPPPASVPLPRAFEGTPAPAPASPPSPPPPGLSNAPSPAPPSPPAAPVELPKKEREPDSMPFFVLVAGIAGLIPCLNVIAAPIAIILGQLTLMRLDEDTPRADRNKVILGTTLGYVSLIALLICAVIWKLKGPAIRAAFGGH